MASLWVNCLVSCGTAGRPLPANTHDVVLLTTESVVADREMLASLSLAFYRQERLDGSHSLDEFDMLVFWASPTLAPASAFFLPVRNDVPGIGYGHVGPEFFDDGDEFGSERLQGIIWMGPDWIENSVAGGDQAESVGPKADSVGPDSVLGILAQETAHRWGATIRFRSEEFKDVSEALLGSPFHWSFLLDTNASPLGGNTWVALGDDLFRAEPVDTLLFSPLDLYLMGLLNAEEVGPIRLLGNARGIEEGTGLFSPQGDRVTHTVTVRADVIEISIDQVIEVEGLRDPDRQSGSNGFGFTAAHIRQAWIFVQEPGAATDRGALDRLDVLAAEWPAVFDRMTGGRGAVSVGHRAACVGAR